MRWMVLLWLMLPLFSLSQKQVDKLKRKYLGNYKGVISNYETRVGSGYVEVAETPIYIRLDKKRAEFIIGNRSFGGEYKIMFMAETYYLLDVTIPGAAATERILVYKNGKRLSRDGMYPQPVTELKKYK